jgi:hypothetical protein
MTLDRDKVILLARGKNGWHAQLLGAWGKASSSGGSLEDYLGDAIEGCPCYDADEADYDAFLDVIFKFPMVDATLKAGEIKRFNNGDKETLVAMLPGLGGDFKTIGKMVLSGFSSVDYVAADVYLQLLKDKVPGIKIGHVSQGKIVWDYPRPAMKVCLTRPDTPAAFRTQR